jgi:cytochrome c oxidase cbb3-type subunit II
MSHAVIETRAGLLGVLIAVVISVGGLVEIVPLYFSSQVTTPAPGVKPNTALQLEGRDNYIS